MDGSGYLARPSGGSCHTPVVTRQPLDEKQAAVGTNRKLEAVLHKLRDGIDRALAEVGGLVHDTSGDALNTLHRR
jgi:hypothetical protein